MLPKVFFPGQCKYLYYNQTSDPIEIELSMSVLTRIIIPLLLLWGGVMLTELEIPPDGWHEFSILFFYKSFYQSSKCFIHTKITRDVCFSFQSRVLVTRSHHSISKEKRTISSFKIKGLVIFCVVLLWCCCCGYPLFHLLSSTHLNKFGWTI